MPSLRDADMIRELIVGARAWASAVMPPQGDELARLSSRNRPGHDLDADYPVRSRADAGRECTAGIYPDLWRPAWSSTMPKTSGRRPWQPCARRLRGQGLTPAILPPSASPTSARPRLFGSG